MDIFYYTVIGVIIVSVLLLFGLEILAKLNDIPNDNVNIIIRNAAFSKLYFITFAFGVISGHLFLGVTFRWFDCDAYNIDMDCAIFDVIVVALLNVIVLLTGLIFKFKTAHPLFHFALFTFGLFIGHYIWSMNVIN